MGSGLDGAKCAVCSPVAKELLVFSTLGDGILFGVSSPDGVPICVTGGKANNGSADLIERSLAYI